MATNYLNNILDSKNEHNFLFLASVIAVLCENSPVTLDLQDVEHYWSGDIQRLQYDLCADEKGQQGSITFSLKPKP
jgi:hypothetical protein